MATTAEGSLVEAARAGDTRAFGELFDTWFDRVHDLSRRIVHDPGTAGEVAQDSFLAAWTRLDTLEDPDAFGGWLLRIARNKSLNRLAKERRSVALDDQTMTTMTDMDAPDHDPLAAMDQAARVALVWDAAAALGERDMSILDLHLRHGLGAGELAEELGTTPNNAHQMLFTLRKRLGTNVRALVLWRAGRPACENLRRTLAGAGIATFDKQAVKVIDRHADVCDECSRERSERVSPAALFGAAPVVAAPFLLKAQAASALEAAGVPMGGSTALAAGTGAAGAPTPAAPGADAISAAGAVGGAGGGDMGTGATPLVAGPAAEEPPADPAPGPASTRRRVLAVAAVLALLVGVAAVLSAVAGESTGGDEVATVAGPTSAPGAASSDPATSTSAGSSSATTPSTDAGGFVVVGEDPPASGATDPPGSAPPGTSPPGSAPPGTNPPGTTPPGTSPPTTAPQPTDPPRTVPPTTTPPPTTAPAAPPKIVRFTATNSGKQCRGGIDWTVSWVTENADSVLVGPLQGPMQESLSSGLLVICHPGAATAPQFLLVAVGPAGQDQQIVTGQ